MDDYWPERIEPCIAAAQWLLELLKAYGGAIPYARRYFKFRMALLPADETKPVYLSICIHPDRNDATKPPHFVEAALLDSDNSVMYDDARGYSYKDEPLNGVRALGPTDGTPVGPAHAKAIADEVARLKQFK